MFFFFEPIPQQLLQRSETDEDVNILVGENGSGKSSLLGEVANHFSDRRLNVIAIANTIYDKFKKSKNIKLQRAALGKSIATNIVKEALINLANDDLKKMRNVANTLEYVGFEPVINFELKGLSPNFRDDVIESTLTASEKEDLLYFLNRYVDKQFSSRDLVRINFNHSTFEDIKNSFLIALFLYEKKLKALKLISSINVYLRKQGRDIPILEASSGELTLVTALIFITSVITERAVILIDEPENSLHPKWQTEYIKRLLELFYFYQPKIIVATHSPLILNGAELASKQIKVFKGESGKFRLYTNDSTNVEEIYQDFFDVITPENRFISEKIIDNINLLAEKQLNEQDFERFINKIKGSSYDEKQKDVLDGIIQLSKEVIKETK